jgi:hypothetical protein
MIISQNVSKVISFRVRTLANNVNFNTVYSRRNAILDRYELSLCKRNGKFKAGEIH